jgi:uncharacterized protein (TIGR02453 family)
MDVKALVGFLQELAENNSKPWFDTQRPRYQTLRQQFTTLVGEVITGVGAVDEAVVGLEPANCIFRINRDARFSRDKSPYKTQFSAAICPQGRGTGMPSYYFHIDATGDLLIGGGIYAPSPAQLANARRFILAHPERIDQLFADPVFRSTHTTIDGDSLKRPPAGVPETARHLDILKRKQYLVGKNFVVHEFADDAIAPLLIDRFRATAPFILWLREATGAPAGVNPAGNGPDPLPIDIF